MTRPSKAWKPSAYRQCTATGTEIRTASRPDQRWTGLTQAPRSGIRPYTPSAVTICTIARPMATLASAALAAAPLENPAMLTAWPVGV